MNSSYFRFCAKILTVIVFLLLTIKAQAKDCGNPPMLESDKPNLLGLAHDSSDNHGYMDISLSVATPLLYGTIIDNNCEATGKWLPYFGINLVAAFYALPNGRRPSSPVVGKTFNPHVTVRRFEEDSDIGSRNEREVNYFDLEYGHLSNGQTVTNLAEFSALATELNSTRSAEDYISRGWDYLGINIHHYFGKHVFGQYQSASINFRQYIGGFLQTSIEEYNQKIETPRGIQALSQVSGIRLADQVGIDSKWIGSVTATLDTGISNPFKWNSLRIDTELLPRCFRPEKSGFSIDLWARTGYNANLSHYYQRIDSVGIAFLFETYKGTQGPAFKVNKTGSNITNAAHL